MRLLDVAEVLPFLNRGRPAALSPAAGAAVEGVQGAAQPHDAGAGDDERLPAAPAVPL